jgi:hypothetical protein
MPYVFRAWEFCGTRNIVTITVNVEVIQGWPGGWDPCATLTITLVVQEGVG